ncbi:unnamed protein product, partial [Amoebophrya sp. A120]
FLHKSTSAYIFLQLQKLPNTSSNDLHPVRFFFPHNKNDFCIRKTTYPALQISFLSPATAYKYFCRSFLAYFFGLQVPQPNKMAKAIDAWEKDQHWRE